MSTEAVAIAMHHSRSKGTARLVLWGIANHDGDGGSWPAIKTLSRYAGGLDARNVQRAIDKLEELGEIRRITNGGGTHRTANNHRPNLYEFRLKCPPGCDGSKRHRVKAEDVVTELDVQLQDGEWVLQPEDPGVAEAPPLSYPQVDNLSTAVAPAPGLGVAPAPPEVNPRKQPSTAEALDQPQTARGPVTDPQLLASMSDEERLNHDLEFDRQRLYRRRCLDGSQLHVFIDAQSDWCEKCGIHRYKDQRKNWNTSEIRPV